MTEDAQWLTPVSPGGWPCRTRLVEQLGLTHYGQRPANQAAGEADMFNIYSALVLWHGRPRPVVVHGTRGSILIGMALLHGSRLIVDSWEGGDVVIEETP